MEIEPQKLIFYYLISLKDILLRQDPEFIEESIMREYNRRVVELGRILDLNLNSYEIKEEDRYFDPEDIEHPQIGFVVSDISSTTNIKIESIENKKYEDI